jgi:DNA-binding NtrC family response regulator
MVICCHSLSDEGAGYAELHPAEEAGKISNVKVVESPKILIIDDDPVFRSIMVKIGTAMGMRVDAFESMLDVDPFSQLNNYDGAIIDYYLGQQDGIDIVSHLRPFFLGMPTVLVSSDPTVELRCKDPLAIGVREFASKEIGAVRIFDKMKKLLSNQSSR